MKRKQLYRFIGIITLFILSLLVFAQAQPMKESNPGFDEKFRIPTAIVVLGFAFGVYQYIRRRKDARRIKIAGLEAEKEFKDQEQGKENKRKKFHSQISDHFIYYISNIRQRGFNWGFILCMFVLFKSQGRFVDSIIISKYTFATIVLVVVSITYPFYPVIGIDILFDMQT
jgi:hypothetical protein